MGKTKAVQMKVVRKTSKKTGRSKKTFKKAVPEIKLAVLPGGKLPIRKTAGSIGFDVSSRAIVCPFKMDPDNPNLRKTLFDFKHHPKDPEVNRHVIRTKGELVYRLYPGESVLVGIGFVTEMPFPMFYWVAPRSGLSSKYGITVTNAPGTVDPDYRGEAGVLVYNRTKKSYDLRHGMRIAQIVFQKAQIPKITVVRKSKGLKKTARGAGGFGSTGLY